MNHKITSLLVCRTSVFLIMFLLLSFTMRSQPSGSKAGAFTVDITPGSPVVMSGYSSRDQPFEGIHDKIYARAIVFDNGITKACIIQADLIGFSHDFSDEISNDIMKKTGIPAENILLVAAHNHGGPSTRVYGTNASKELDKYIVQLKKDLVRAAVEADNNKVDAVFGFGRGTCTMNINRRARQANGAIWLGRNPDGPCDTDVDVFKISSLQNTTRALLVNWPCHATTGGQNNRQITGDWPGAAARFVTNELGQNITVAVTAGASADINPIYGPNDKFGDIEAIGMLLGEEIVRVSENIEVSLSDELAVVRRELMVPGKERSASRGPNEEINPAGEERLTLTVLKVGKSVFVGISGELMTEIGMKIKELSPLKTQ